VHTTAISYGVPYFGPSDFSWTAVKDFFVSAMQAAFSGDMSAQQALDEFVRQANAAAFGR
jgi:maltose-binding protein MalE